VRHADPCEVEGIHDLYENSGSLFPEAQKVAKLLPIPFAIFRRKHVGLVPEAQKRFAHGGLLIALSAFRS